ncbi:LOW QUALITY PROTEIN: uncharacterized protein LOC124374442, partial [Homalodisca vitripennis]|uniref:LOW QUALITY PROTEIN: uncharacterized protein LOC124374442 n=1 Tax=Homalodisca vitripennis TaxID=197043 RepID=UPI001EEBFE7F
MQIFTEAELRLKFLQVRDSWLQSELAKIPSDDATHHLTKTIELSRIHLFNIVTQYRAVFTDEEHIITSRQLALAESSIFQSWLNQKISQFLTTLDQDLLRGVGSSLASLLGQCMYFGLSLSSVGADFRALVAPVFVRAVKRNLETSVRKASKKFEADMDKFTLPKSQPQVKTGTPTQKSGIKQEQPPESLLEFYPLAEYCNNLLVGPQTSCVYVHLSPAQRTQPPCYRTHLPQPRPESSLHSTASREEKEGFSRFLPVFPTREAAGAVHAACGFVLSTPYCNNAFGKIQPQSRAHHLPDYSKQIIIVCGSKRAGYMTSQIGPAVPPRPARGQHAVQKVLSCRARRPNKSVEREERQEEERLVNPGAIRRQLFLDEPVVAPIGELDSDDEDEDHVSVQEEDTASEQSGEEAEVPFLEASPEYT